MPIYCFSLDVKVTPQVVAERLKSIVREKRQFSNFEAWQSTERASPPFIGTVQDDSFRIRRDIRSRNSFLPLIWGRVVPIGTGARVSVTMFIHPLVALIVMLWLGMAANFAVTLPSPFVPSGMFILGVALMIGGFFPEAMKARRLISEAVNVRLY